MPHTLTLVYSTMPHNHNHPQKYNTSVVRPILVSVRMKEIVSLLSTLHWNIALLILVVHDKQTCSYIYCIPFSLDSITIELLLEHTKIKDGRLFLINYTTHQRKTSCSWTWSWGMFLAISDTCSKTRYCTLHYAFALIWLRFCVFVLSYIYIYCPAHCIRCTQEKLIEISPQISSKLQQNISECLLQFSSHLRQQSECRDCNYGTGDS